MFLQGNLPLKFKEGGTLFGRQHVLEDSEDFWREAQRKREKKKSNRNQGCPDSAKGSISSNSSYTCQIVGLYKRKLVVVAIRFLLTVLFQPLL
ncbi:unnamed protein product, partial [Vitis vinifera]|uniref:Uncharacterized protein n=1 Tax=Vitis vinifera TaxID=29760 RepID=D7TXR9_VITVI